MAAASGFTLSKKERICSKKLTDQLFTGGSSRSLSAYPLRAVYMTHESDGAPASILVSVPKKHLKRAVMRNRVKRQVREAYRKHKQIVTEKASEATGRSIAIAFIWMDSKLVDTSVVESRMVSLLHRIVERL